MDLAEWKERWGNIVRIGRAAAANFGARQAFRDVQLDHAPRPATQDLLVALANGAAVERFPDWVWPYWMEQQFDPASPAFIPMLPYRAFSNVTCRNWTVFGPPDSGLFGTVDPHGLLSPKPGGWSLDIWVTESGRTWLPSRLKGVGQEVGDPIPEVCTIWTAGDIAVKALATGAMIEGFPWALLRVNLLSLNDTEGALHFSVRPYGPLGVSPIHDLTFLKNAFGVNGRLGVVFLDAPDRVDCSDGLSDVYSRMDGPDRHHALCRNGLGTALASFGFTLRAGTPGTIRAFLPMAAASVDGAWPAPVAEELFRPALIRGWQDRTGLGIQVRLPDAALTRAIRANTAYLHLLGGKAWPDSGEEDGAGLSGLDLPLTVTALDAWGLHERAATLLRERAEMLDQGPMGRTKAASRGRLLWAMASHYSVTGDRDYLEQIYPSLLSALRRVSSGRGVKKPLADGADWGLWAAVALQEASAVIRAMGQTAAAEHWRLAARRLIGSAKEAIEDWAVSEMERAAPDRGHPGRLAEAWFALLFMNIFELGDSASREALIQLARSKLSTENGLFARYGDTVPMNWLAALCLASDGDTGSLDTLAWALERTGSTFAWPEALHPRTGGGSFGDGHSRMATAAFLTFIRHLLLHENGDTLVIGGLMPSAWFEAGQSVEIGRAPTRFGPVGYAIQGDKDHVELQLDGDYRVFPQKILWTVPFEVGSATVDGVDAHHRQNGIYLLPQTRRVVLKRAELHRKNLQTPETNGPA